MTSAAPADTAPPDSPGATRDPGARATARSQEPEILLGTALSLVVLLALTAMPGAIVQDTWLALVAGREVYSGIPDRESLTLLAAGRPWVDQQWASQLLMHGLWRIGGLGLVGVVHVALLSCGVVGAAMLARRLGAHPYSIVVVLPLTLCVALASHVRTESFGYPIFAAILFLLAADSRAPTSRVLWCLPLLVLWANLHGAASLGAGLVVLRGLTIAWERRRMLTETASASGLPLMLVVGAPGCLLLTPYGTSMAAYYHDTLLNSGFRDFVTEWQPVTSIPFLAAVLVLFGGLLIWSLIRCREQTTLWERCALLCLLLAAVSTVRNISWFGLAATALLPVAIDGAVRARLNVQRLWPRLVLALGACALVAVVASVVVALGRPESAYEDAYPAKMQRAVQAATTTQPSLRVLSDARYADWLLWKQPRLRGRLAYDARFELLTTAQLKDVAAFSDASGAHWKRAARGYGLLVLDSSRSSKAVRALRKEQGSRVLYQDASAIVILRAS